MAAWRITAKHSAVAAVAGAKAGRRSAVVAGGQSVSIVPYGLPEGNPKNSKALRAISSHLFLIQK